MKLLVATGLFPPQIGGPATYSKLLQDELPKHNVGVTVVNFGDVRHLPFFIRHFFYLLKLLRDGHRHDLIYAQDTVSVGIAAALASYVLFKPLWVRVPGHHEWEQAVQRFGVTATLDEYVTSPPRNLFLRCMRLGTALVFSRAERIVVPSHYMSRVLVSSGVAPQKIKIIYSSIRRPEIAGDRKALRSRLDLPEGRVIVSAGRLVPWKGFQELISTFSELKGTLFDITLVIAGDGPLMATLKEHARSLGVEDSVRFTGTLSQVELFSYIRAGDVFVLNTAYEGLSHLLIEVMALGTPIITTPVGGNTELITDGKEGLLVAYNSKVSLKQAVQKILSDSALGEGFASRAKDKAEAFMAKDSASVLLEEFRTLGYV